MVFFFISARIIQNASLWRTHVETLCIPVRINLPGIDAYCISPGPICFVWISKQYYAHDGQNRNFTGVDWIRKRNLFRLISLNTRKTTEIELHFFRSLFLSFIPLRLSIFFIPFFFSSFFLVLILRFSNQVNWNVICTNVEISPTEDLEGLMSSVMMNFCKDL